MSPWSSSVFDPSIVSAFAEDYINSDNCTLFVHDYGIIGGTTVSLFFGTGVVANETFWFADKHGRLLLEAFEQWAKEKGADKILLSSLAFDDKRDKLMTNFYKRMGYSPIETHFSKDVV